MNAIHIAKIAKELGINAQQVRATGELLEQSATVPFIARYRKEATGTLDEVVITAIRDRLEQLAELDKRREAIVQSLTERELLTDELSGRIQAAELMSELEDIYLPFRPKRRTRATIAREKGLEPLAQVLLAQNAGTDPVSEAQAFICADTGAATAEDALDGARDIIAEMITEDADARSRVRGLFASKGIISTSLVKDKDEEAAKFRDYFEWSESVTSAPSHRVLAMMRGEKEGFLKLRINPPDDSAENILRSIFITGTGSASAQVELALQDGYKRLFAPSMETEIRSELKQRADTEAIRVFSDNIRELLLAAPLGEKRMMAIDPGFRTGCKVVCLDSQGKLLYNEAIFPHTGGYKAVEAGQRVSAMCDRYEIEVIAIGNGTASRETESFVRGLNLPGQIPIVMVNESGASIYSASEAAREEFPDYDITVRGAVSIGRRLMDPLAELVKIDPKSIGVGQYQHDIDQGALKRSLDDSVESCVNKVGVDINTASKQLLTYVSGLGPQLARNIVAYRDENGPFASRVQIKKVKGLGPKAFEQAAGFLRIQNARNPLDASAVHPESYGIVAQMSTDLGRGVQDLLREEALRAQIRLDRYINDKVGMPTLQDIMQELAKPGRDPRAKFEVFQFADGIEKIDDLEVGMRLPGIVTNVTAFGAFVDIGVHQDGLVHISQLADKFVRDPSEVVKVQQKVDVTVMSVDVLRKRISLSMRSAPN